jgi:hypothetical protein
LPAASDTVTAGPAATADPRTPGIVALLEQYFAAINTRDYRGYRSLLTAQRQAGLTRGGFIAGYRSTADSAEVLRRVGTGASGETVAVVVFTSHQDPADSANGQSCTRWRISLFLQPTGGGYAIGLAPPGHHDSYSACH